MDIGLNNHYAFRGANGSMSPTVGEVHRAAQPIREMSKNRINTTASREMNNTCGRLSFKGVQSTIANDTTTWAQRLGAKIANSTKAQSILAKIETNRLLSEAIFAVALTCILRPLTIMATPTKGEENKQKNRYAAAKSVSTGLVGLGATFLINPPNKKGVQQAEHNLKKANRMIDSAYAEDFAKYVEKTGLNPEKETAELKEQLFTDITNSYNKMLKSAKTKLENVVKENDTEKAVKKATAEATSKIKKLEELAPTKDGVDKLIGVVKELFTKEQISEIIEKAKGSKAEIADQTKSIRKSIAEGITNCNNVRTTVLEKAIGPVFFPGKAMLTIALVPVILKALGIKKTSQPKQAQQPITTAQQNTPSIQKDINPVFKSIAGVNK